MMIDTAVRHVFLHPEHDPTEKAKPAPKTDGASRCWSLSWVPHRALDQLLRTKMLDAQEAHAAGFVVDVCDDPGWGRRCRTLPGREVPSCYAWWVANTITFRPDEDAQRALDALTADGTAVSSAVRSGLIDAAWARARQRLRSEAEAEAIASDADDRAEAAQVLKDMETQRAW